MTQSAQPSIRVNGESEPLAAATLAVLLEEKASTSPSAASRSRSMARSCRATAWGETRLNPGDSVEIVRARQGG